MYKSIFYFLFIILVILVIYNILTPYIIKKVYNSDIDVVYSWAGMNSGNDVRNRYNHELEYSLKSIIHYLPWINKIYILVNSDVEIPKWINNKKIFFINRSNLIENKKYSLTKNSFAVYSIVDKIPNLNEKFILLDDDFFCNGYVSPDYFFSSEGRPLVRIEYKRRPVYHENIKLPYNLYRPLYKYNTHSHRPMPFTKTIIKLFRNQYPEYNQFVESHITRFYSLSENMPMIYYEFGLQKNLIIIVKERISTFFQIRYTHSDDMRLEFICNRIKLMSPFIKWFNCNDDFSNNVEIYKQQSKVLKTFYESLYYNIDQL